MKKRILYGIANYAELVEKNGYFVDKTHWLAELEQVNNPVLETEPLFLKTCWVLPKPRQTISLMPCFGISEIVCPLRSGHGDEKSVQQLRPVTDFP